MYMVRYELYDEFGKKIHDHFDDALTFAPKVIKKDGKFFRPVLFDLNVEPQIAKCTPIEVIDCG